MALCISIPTVGIQVQANETKIVENVNVAREMETEESGEVKQKAARSEIRSGTCGEDATYILDSEGTLVISGTGYVEYQGFMNNSEIQKVIIEEGITSIGDSAFCGCSSLSSIDIPESVTSIGYYAFENCTGLESISLPESVTSIGYNAFENCSKLTIYCSKNSEAHTYAVENDIPYSFGEMPKLENVTVSFDKKLDLTSGAHS